MKATNKKLIISNALIMKMKNIKLFNNNKIKFLSLKMLSIYKVKAASKNAN